jgi:cyclopropane-fatty-acyl-phospholipid synthase
VHRAETPRRRRQFFFMARRDDEAVSLYDERFFRMWKFYLVLCEIGSRLRTNMMLQIQLTSASMHCRAD